MSEEYAPPLASVSPESVAEDISEFFIGAARTRGRPRRPVRRRVRHPAHPVHHAPVRHAAHHAPAHHAAHPASAHRAPPRGRPVARPVLVPLMRPGAPVATQYTPSGAPGGGGYDESPAEEWQGEAADDAYDDGADPDEGYDAFRDTAIGAARPRRAARPPANPYILPAAWYRPRLDVVALFKKKKGTDPTDGDLGRMAYIVKYAKGGIRAGNESTFENGYQMLAYFLKKGSLPPQKLVNPGGALAERARAIVQQHIHAYHAAHHGFFDDINPVKAITAAAKWAGRAVGTVAHAAGAVVHAASDVLGHIPVVGGPLHDVLEAANPFAMIESISKGERIDKAVLGDLKNKLAVVKEIAPYAATVASLVPGVGSGVAAALSAASALASGRNITDALIEGVKNAVPGGPVARSAFETAVSLSKGNRIDKALLDAARAQIPAEARAAFDTGMAIAHGKNLQSVVVDGIKSAAPGVLGDLAKQGDKLVGASKLLGQVRAIVPAHEIAGFNLGTAVMHKAGVTPQALVAFRNKLSPPAKLGFDKALVTHTARGKLAAKKVVRLAVAGIPGTVVIRSSDPKKNGRQMTGRWRHARPGQGVQGILVQGKVQHLGWWNRAA